MIGASRFSENSDCAECGCCMFVVAAFAAVFALETAFSNASVAVIGPGEKAQFQARFQCDALRLLGGCPLDMEPDVLHGSYLYLKAVEDGGATVAVSESLCVGVDVEHLAEDELGVCANIANWEALAFAVLAVVICVAFLLCCCSYLVA